MGVVLTSSYSMKKFGLLIKRKEKKTHVNKSVHIYQGTKLTSQRHQVTQELLSFQNQETV